MRTQPLAACLALAILVSIGVVPAMAQSAPTPTAPATSAPVQGNAANGRLLTYTCQGCHGVTGYKNAYPSYRIPKIGGQSTQYLTQALTEYRLGKRKHPTMQAQAESFSEQDIADIAAFLSTLK
ncbi:c-type cytochrome [Xanthomonas albilineans]|uniref:c-type cytochrome n=1 Tax=Xanthomonas albilineans TaxID=29447 RepID=UPI0005F356D6|nr:cytochrome c [Xanthomonas albilineans]PPU91953.1 cytochrome C [Xanthomonas albilineans]